MEYNRPSLLDSLCKTPNESILQVLLDDCEMKEGTIIFRDKDDYPLKTWILKHIPSGDYHEIYPSDYRDNTPVISSPLVIEEEENEIILPAVWRDPDGISSLYCRQTAQMPILRFVKSERQSLSDFRRKFFNGFLHDKWPTYGRSGKNAKKPESFHKLLKSILLSDKQDKTLIELDILEKSLITNEFNSKEFDTARNLHIDMRFRYYDQKVILNTINPGEDWNVGRQVLNDSIFNEPPYGIDIPVIERVLNIFSRLYTVTKNPTQILLTPTDTRSLVASSGFSNHHKMTILQKTNSCNENGWRELHNFAKTFGSIPIME